MDRYPAIFWPKSTTMVGIDSVGAAVELCELGASRVRVVGKPPGLETFPWV